MLQNIGLPGLLLIAVVILVMFGRGKVANLMGEVGKGINAFKKGVKETDEVERDVVLTSDGSVTRVVTPLPEKDKI